MSGERRCSREGCTASFDSHKWGTIRAAEAGWFMRRNGEAWCPEHHPEWVAAWRERHAQQSKPE